MKAKKNKHQTAKEIAQDILKNLDEESIQELSKAEPDEFGSYSYQYHFTLGMQIRNVYNLWERPDIEPDEFSGIIIDDLINMIKHNKSANS